LQDAAPRDAVGGCRVTRAGFSVVPDLRWQED
jgi:hypothetical protein